MLLLNSEWDKTFKITGALIERESDFASTIQFNLDAGAFTSELKFYIEHSDMELQRSGQDALREICERLYIYDVKETSEFVGKTISLDDVNAVRRHASEHARLIYPDHIRRMREDATSQREILSAEAGRYVYVISCQDSSTPLCKIGIASSPERRLKQLSTSSPHTLRLDFARYAADARAVEASSHVHFAKCRQNGEWFALPAHKAITFVNDNIDRTAA